MAADGRVRYPRNLQQQQQQPQQQTQGLQSSIPSLLPLHHRQQLPPMFQSSQLPPPSQLHQLPPASYRGNTLAPISSLPQSSPPQSVRYPPPNYHPSLSSSSTSSNPLASQQQQSASALSSSSSAAQLPWPTTHRTSASLDDRYASDRDAKPLSPTAPALSHRDPPREAASEESMPPTSDFVKKLYKMLEDQSVQHVVSWGPHGDCFVVKDMNEFTKSILPRMFKHSNFASFVRQLNKYDFHKVKNTDDNAFGEHSWTFRHPDFHADRRDALENIKRKVPAARKSTGGGGGGGGGRGTAGSPSPSSGTTVEVLQAQVDRLLATQEEMAAHIRQLENNYQGVVGQLVAFQQDMAKQDGITRLLIQSYLNGSNNGGAKGEQAQPAQVQPQSQSQQQESQLSAPFASPDDNPFLPRQETQRMVGVPDADVADIARASLFQMNEISRQAEAAGISFADTLPSGPELDPPARPQSSAERIFAAAASLLAPPPPERPLSRQDTIARLQELQTQVPQALDTPFLMPPADSYPAVHEGLQVFTLGHLLPRSGVDDVNGNWTFDPASLEGLGLQPMPDLAPEASSGNNTTSTNNINGTANSGSGNSQTLRVRRSTFVPGWSVPPRVLLVEDDAVSRKLSSKFLQVFGCTTDVAVDGEVAVNMMNLAKYDLVLMDIVMPKLDGVTATTLIRQFDPNTPIISMTSNSKPNEIMTYYSHGMNDILPKPFTKEGLLEMLERHLVHFRQIQETAQLPRQLGAAGTLEDDGETVLPSTQNSTNTNALVPAPAADADIGKIDPLMAMGLTEQKYGMILSSMVAFGGAFGGEGSLLGKRGLEESDERDGKRGRFEEVLE